MPVELKVMSARAVKAAVAACAEKFSRATGCPVACEFAPVGAVQKKLAEGAVADVVILSRAAIKAMQETGTLAEGSVTSLGTTSIGVAVREDAPVPDISTPQAFKALLLSARTISVSDVAVGGTAAVYLPKLFERMEIAAALEPKLVRCSGGGDVTERVARGEAEIGITFVSEMLPIAGVAVIGKLPEPYGNDTTYCAGVTAKSRVGGEAAAFVAALADPVMASVWQRAGFELSKRP